jgi:hypothetical protein
VAGGLMGSIGLTGVILIDFTSFLFAISILLFVHIPRAAATAEGRAGRGTVLQETIYGWKYIMARRGLAALMLLFAFSNFTTEMTSCFSRLSSSARQPNWSGISLSGFSWDDPS